MGCLFNQVAGRMKRYQPRQTVQPARPQPKASINIIEALCDRNLLGSALGDPTSWTRWLAVLKAAYALPMNASDLAAFREVAAIALHPVNACGNCGPRSETFWESQGCSGPGRLCRRLRSPQARPW